jgi:hypothetical protein
MWLCSQTVHLYWLATKEWARILPERWTTPFRSGCWQCWKKSLVSRTPLLLGASCVSAASSPYNSTNFVLHCASTILWLNATAPLPKKFYMLICGSGPGLMIAGIHTFSQPWLAWFKITCSKKSCRIVNRLTSAVLSWTLERDTWIFGRLNLMATHVSATAKFYAYNGWCALPPRSSLLPISM